jgi:hypothetical protein
VFFFGEETSQELRIVLEAGLVAGIWRVLSACVVMGRL